MAGNVGELAKEYLRSKIFCDKRNWWLWIDKKDLVLEGIDLGNGKGSKKIAQLSLRIPISEILAVTFSDDSKRGKTDDGCACCITQSVIKSDGKIIRHLSTKDLALLSKLSSNPVNENRSTDNLNIVDRRGVCLEQETEAIAVYFICRKADHVWRVGRLVFYFNVLGEAAYDNRVFDTSPSVTAAEFLRHLRTRMFLRPKRLLVFVNPYGGKKRAVQLYKDFAAPIFALCGISTTVVTTERANHAKDFVTETDLLTYDGIVTTGGDGLFNEVLNGLVVRRQRETNVDINDRKADLTRPNIVVGVISAGSTNALAHTIHGTGDVLTSILHIAIGDRRGVDVCGVYDQERFLRFASTAVSYGFLGDLLKESDQLRRFGPPRYVMAGAKVWMKNPHYDGVVRYKTVSKDDGNAKKMNLKPCRSVCDLCTDGGGETGGENALVKRPLSTPSLVGDDDNDQSWTIVDDFTHLVGLVTPCLCEMAPKGIGPNCHLGDGYLHLAVVSRVGRFQNLALIARLMSKSMDHTRARKFRLYVVKEFSFTPKSMMKPIFTRSSSDVVINVSESEINANKNAGERDQLTPEKRRLGGWNMDGEWVAQPEGSIYFRVHQQLITLFARGIETTSS